MMTACHSCGNAIDTIDAPAYLGRNAEEYCDPQCAADAEDSAALFVAMGETDTLDAFDAAFESVWLGFGIRPR